MSVKKDIFPDFSIESSFRGNLIVGIDEAGRGPLAGPLVAAAVILNEFDIPAGINDSKQLTAKRREALYNLLIEKALYGVGVATVEEIDNYKLTCATELAMSRAINAIKILPEIALVDGNFAYKLPCRAIPIVNGDCRSLSIAAASIIAKVIRDKMMHELACEFPFYEWDRNVGYGTSSHITAIKTHGITIHHRKSFAPIREMFAAKQLCLFEEEV